MAIPLQMLRLECAAQRLSSELERNRGVLAQHRKAKEELAQAIASTEARSLSTSLEAGGPQSSTFLCEQSAATTGASRSLPSVQAPFSALPNQKRQEDIPKQMLGNGSCYSSVRESSRTTTGEGIKQRSVNTVKLSSRPSSKQCLSMSHRLRHCVSEARRNHNELMDRRKVISDVLAREPERANNPNLHFLGGLSLLDRSTRLSQTRGAIAATTSVSSFALEPLDSVSHTVPPPHVLPGSKGGMLARLNACEMRANHNKEVVAAHRQFLDSYEQMQREKNGEGARPLTVG
mmetsp:Transcript_60373/g.112033  ORF Transcript_60373/g.112033 Transcript_60373/m.112033 type:complete len:290 (-) Transcript_60373:184-1053(-)